MQTHWRLVWAGSVAAMLATGTARAQESESPPAGAAEAAAADPELIRLFMVDGSVLAGKLSVQDLELETTYGRLLIPVTAIKSLTPGMGRRPDLKGQVAQWIEQLGAADFEQRETAQQELLKVGRAARLELEKRQTDKDTERRTRIKAILAELDDQADDAEGSPPVHERDTIETLEFTAVGNLLTKEFTVDSRYGPLLVKLADLRHAQRDAVQKSELRKTVTVDGVNLVQRGLKNVSLRLEKGDKVSITADGSLTMTPWGNGAVSSPDGGVNFGWYVANSIPSGALVGAIGASGKVFKIGAKHSFEADRTGELHLAVAMQNEYANQNFPGRYTVKVRIQRK
jgi:hypothetical protein